MISSTNNPWYALAWIASEQGFAVIATTNIGNNKIFKSLEDNSGSY